MGECASFHSYGLRCLFAIQGSASSLPFVATYINLFLCAVSPLWGPASRHMALHTAGWVPHFQVGPRSGQVGDCWVRAVKNKSRDCNTETLPGGRGAELFHYPWTHDAHRVPVDWSVSFSLTYFTFCEDTFSPGQPKLFGGRSGRQAGQTAPGLLESITMGD